jgi:hypothetical protein
MSGSQRKNQSRCRWVVALILLLHAALLALIGARNSPTMNEVAHLASGLCIWRSQRLDLYRVNPPLVRAIAALPVLACSPRLSVPAGRSVGRNRLELSAAAQFIRLNGPSVFGYCTVARWACIPFSVIGALCCYQWARKAYGAKAAFVALVAWCFSPSILGNASLITNDVPCAALGIVAGYSFWRWLHQPTAWRAALAGLALGLAQLSKFTWVMMFALWPMLWLAWRLLPGLARAPSNSAFAFQPNAPPPARQLALMLLLSLWVVNAGYNFDGSFARLGDFGFVSRALGGEGAADRPANRFRGTMLAGIPVPFPKDWVMGIDVQRLDFELPQRAYLRGRWSGHGWWYYYLYAVGIKEPLGLLLLAGVAVAGALSGRAGPTALGCARTSHQFSRRDLLVLLAPGIGLFVLVSSQTGMNRFMRYVVPALPFLYVFIAGTFARLPMPPPWHAVARVGLLVWAVVASLGTCPHNLSYFNELVGGPAGGPSQLLDANVDWGQDLLHLARWHRNHPHARPFHVEYFGVVEPKLAGIEARPAACVTPAMRRANVLSQRRPPGWYAVSVNLLYGFQSFQPLESCFDDLLERVPVARAGYSIWIYRVDGP